MFFWLRVVYYSYVIFYVFEVKLHPKFKESVELLLMSYFIIKQTEVERSSKYCSDNPKVNLETGTLKSDGPGELDVKN